MESPPTASLPTLESNLDHLLQELQQLATRVKPRDQHQQSDDEQGGDGNYLVASGRS